MNVFIFSKHAVVKALIALMLGPLPHNYETVRSLNKQVKALTALSSVDEGQARSLLLKDSFIHFLHAWRNIFKKSLFKDVWVLRISVFHLFRPLKCKLFSLLAHAGSHLLPLHLAAFRVGLQGGRVSLQPKPSLACLQWLTSNCLALVDHCLVLCVRGLLLGAKCLHLLGNEDSFDEA